MSTVLVVDDEPALRKGLARVLRTRGYCVLVAESAEEAIDVVKRSQPDVMLTDLRMAGAGGIELISAIRELAPDVRSILMSAFASADDYRRATELGAVTVLVKPFGPDDLVDAVRHAVDCVHGLRGTVHGLSLVDLLQMFHFGRRTIALRFESPAGSEIVLSEGQIIHACHGDATGTVALRRLMRLSTGSIRTCVPACDVPVTVLEPFQALLLDALREADEADRSPPSARPSELDDAFDEWSSLRPGAPSEERLRMLRALLERVAPPLGVVLIDEAAQRVIPIREQGPAPDWLTVLQTLDVDLHAMTDGRGAEMFEWVRGGVAVAILRKRKDGYAIALDAPLFGRLAAHRFRSHVRQVFACLPESI